MFFLNSIRGIGFWRDPRYICCLAFFISFCHVFLHYNKRCNAMDGISFSTLIYLNTLDMEKQLILVDRIARSEAIHSFWNAKRTIQSTILLLYMFHSRDCIYSTCLSVWMFDIMRIEFDNKFGLSLWLLTYFLGQTRSLKQHAFYWGQKHD